MNKDAAKWYVYELIDPRDWSVFYVGKGKDDRVREHEKEAHKGVCSAKCDRINDIESHGLNIIRRQVAVFWCEKSAYDFEKKLIFSYPNLTNLVYAPRPKKLSVAGALKTIDNMSYYFAWWLINIYPHKKDVIIPHPCHFTESVMNIFFNGLAKSTMKTAASTSDGKMKLSNIFKPYGIELAYGS